MNKKNCIHASTSAETKSPQRSSIFVQYKALLLRNLIIKKKEKSKTITEFVMPLYCILILALVRMFVKSTIYEPITKEHDGAHLQFNSTPLLDGNVFVAPNTLQIQAVMEELEIISDVPSMSVVYFDSEDDLVLAYSLNRNVSVAIVFLSNDTFKDPNYVIRINPAIEYLVSPSTLMTPEKNCRQNISEGLEGGYSCKPNSYFSTGFLTLQSLIDYSIIKLSTNKTPPTVDVYLQSFPLNEFTSGGAVALRSIVPLYMVFAWAQFIIYMMILIVEEKEKKIKEGMKMMGLRSSVYWLSWLTIYFSYVVILAVICIIVLPLAQVFRYANLSLLFILFVLYGLSSIILALMLTPFFNKAKLAGIVGQLLQVFMGLLFYLQVYLGDEISPLTFWFLALLSPCAFSLAIDKAILFDFSEGGLDWSNIWDGDGLPYAGSLIMISVDIILYFVLALYFDNVIPTEYGTQQKPWFIFKKSTWIKRKEKSMLDVYSIPYGEANWSYDSNDDVPNPDIEPFPSEWKGREAVRIRNLHKVYRSKGKDNVHAVNGISMDIYQGQITAILGHNGAGKTTLFNILTGLTASTDGSAVIFNYLVSDQNDLAEIRKQTGVCPQHDTLFLTLTPTEHLTFYGLIKGVDPTLIESHVKAALEEIDLGSKADTKADDLSGGQKRKLSIGIALIGDPKIIFLDEPTAGVDAYSRRRLWSLLKRKKEGKVILLTTHFMDEADILADRKAIISKGKLRCYGTSMFLKNKFGLGYHLTLVISEKDEAAQVVENQVKSVIQNADLVRHCGKEVSFILPSSSSILFSQLFIALDKNIADDEGVESYGVSMTTLEEVFLSLNEERECEGEIESVDNLSRNILRARSAARDSIGSSSPSLADFCPNSLGGSGGSRQAQEEDFSVDQVIVEKSTWRAFKALVKLRFTNILREATAVFFMVFMPLGFVVASMALSNGMNVEFANDDLILLNTDLYASSGVNVVLIDNETGHSLSPFESVLRYFHLVPTSYDGDYDFLYKNQPHFSTFDTFAFDKISVDLVLRYNTSFAHVLPILINVLNNAIFSSLINGTTSVISTASRQLPLLESGATKFDFGAYFSPVMIGFVFTMIPAGLVIDIVYDREINGRNVLRLNGVNFAMYFSSFFCIIGFLYAISYVGLLIIIKAFEVPSLTLTPAYVCLAVLYLIYMPSALLFSGCVSYLFDKEETARQFYPSFATTAGFICYTVVSLVDIFNGSKVSLPLHTIFTIFVPYYIPFGVLYYVNKVYIFHSLTGSLDDITISAYMTTEIILMFVISVIDIFIYYILLRIIDTIKLGGDIREALWMKNIKSADLSDSNEDSTTTLAHADDDVIAEREKILSSLKRESEMVSPAVVFNLQKTYGKKRKNLGVISKLKQQNSKEMTAVKSLSFEVRPGEVFGLLGPNGAGKTSTIRIMNAEEPPTHGKVIICGYNINSSLSSAYEYLGYCPQHDCLWKNITIDEHIECFANISGVRKDQVKRLVNTYVSGLQIGDHRKKKSKDCSGGTKRKLSYILSMMGRPKIVLMDEPSTGMDPQSKRFLWNSILASFKGDRCALLTTHSMEEADALCSRIGILVKGELRCIGSIQHLKNKYGSGYNLEVKIRKEASLTTRLENAQVTSVSSLTESSDPSQLFVSSKNRQSNFKTLIRTNFPNCLIDDEFEEKIVFKIPQSDIPTLAELFDTLEKLKADGIIEEYALSQTTLEQVFLRFARLQEEEEEDTELSA